MVHTSCSHPIHRGKNQGGWGEKNIDHERQPQLENHHLVASEVYSSDTEETLSLDD